MKLDTEPDLKLQKIDTLFEQFDPTLFDLKVKTIPTLEEKPKYLGARNFKITITPAEKSEKLRIQSKTNPSYKQTIDSK